MAIDPKNGEIVAETATLNNIHDSEALGPILDQVPRSCKAVLADGAYDGKTCQ
ncbi:MAG: transposase [Chlamydiales bacterium]|nr:transposase [Chlamydiales bacterium]